MPASGGPAERLTWLGEKAAVVAWTGDDRVVYTSATGQPFSTLTLAYAHGDAGAERLPFGPVGDVAFGPNGAVVVGRNTADPARWKRYRGGTAGALWIDPDGGRAPTPATWRHPCGSTGGSGSCPTTRGWATCTPVTPTGTD
jgi:tricorn protease